jgi:hypothetical protein
MDRMSRATVLGLDVWSDGPLRYLQGARAQATGRSLDVMVDRRACADLGWPRRTELISLQRRQDGSELFRIEADPETGYLLRRPGEAAHLLSADGLRLRCGLGEGGADEWQRSLIAHVLPFAAALKGLEVLRASAVVLDGRAVALLGPSGAGKTSLALALCRLGASFLADAVLAVERVEGSLVGHPGTPVAAVDHSDPERLPDPVAHRELLALNARERLVQIGTAGEPAVLAALFFLDRSLDGPPQPSFEPMAGAQALLASTFDFVLEQRECLQRLLALSAVASRRRVERVRLGPSVDASTLAEALMRRLDL